MTKESLSEKKVLRIGIGVYREKDVKEKIQNAQRRLKKEIGNSFCPDCDLKVSKCKCSYKKLFVAIDRNFTDKIFLEEFGEKLMGGKKRK